MRDFFDQELKEGDLVAYLSHSRTSSELRMGFVDGFTKCFVNIREGTGPLSYTTRVAPYKVIRK